jgi:MoxR-like ATPase
MNTSPQELLITHTYKEIDAIIAAANRIILGKESAIRLALACLFARGHLLIEDLPGVGKTTLSHVLASTLGLGFQRIQFTSDLLPADILGVSVYSRETGAFSFHPGPIFTQVILADEINRATPRTQSALLEAMEEQQVTIEGETRPLPEPFFVIATQNPSHQVGTFPLPESQLDRFMMRIELGYPDNKAERELLMGTDRRELLKQIKPVIKPERLNEIQHLAEKIHASSAILDYLQDLLEYSRRSNEFQNGLSPRAGLAVLHCAKAWALMEGHAEVLPEDVQAILPSVIGHRLHSLQGLNTSNRDLASQLIKQVPIP